MKWKIQRTSTLEKGALTASWVPLLRLPDVMFTSVCVQMCSSARIELNVEESFLCVGIKAQG